ncbi:MAG: glycosyltransferase family 4 protein [Deltaproteobacteria bacterium]|nr:glycosyltransferase family 4 protein [Deltaproteobacteria bacterium]
MITYTGIGRYIQNLLTHLPMIDQDNSFSAVTGPKGAAIPPCSNLYVRPLLRDIPVYALIREQFGLPGEMNRFNPDVFHYPSFNMPLNNPKPAVVTIHDLVYYLAPGACSRLRHWYARVVFPLVARRAMRVITGSEHTKRDIVNHLGVDPAKITVIYHGVSSLYRPVADVAAVDAVKRRYGLEGDYILYVGTHHPRKNLKRLIEAFAMIKPKGVRLAITGAMEERRLDLYETPERFGVQERVVFTGPVREEDLPALYSGATIFVIPSLYEGFGLTPLEAMACGAPVISSNLTSLPEVVGDAAMTFNPLDVEALAGCMQTLLNDGALRASLREKGIARARLFNWKRTAEQTLGVYCDALSGRP